MEVSFPVLESTVGSFSFKLLEEVKDLLFLRGLGYVFGFVEFGHKESYVHPTRPSALKTSQYRTLYLGIRTYGVSGSLGMSRSPNLKFSEP